MKDLEVLANELRAARIPETLNTYIRERDNHGNGDQNEFEPEDIIDLLTDLMHWCKQHDEPFEEHLESAQGNFEAEVEEEREDVNDNPGGPSEISVQKVR